jgi:hypothetical protein
MYGAEVSAKKPEKASTWRPPTRRAFVAMLAAAAAAIVVKEAPTETARSTWNGKTRWIGHC